MHLLPLLLAPLPDAGFAAAVRDRLPVAQPLGEAGVAKHHGIVAQPAQMRASWAVGWPDAAAWLVLSELGCAVRWLLQEPEQLEAGRDLSTAEFPVLAAEDGSTLERFLPWGEALVAQG